MPEALDPTTSVPVAVLVVFAVLPFVAAVMGGVAALRLRHRIHPIMALAAGLVVGTAFVNLLPEATHLLGEDGQWLVGVAAIAGFLAFSALEDLVHLQTWEHGHQPHDDPAEPHEHPPVPARRGSTLGIAAPLGVIVHSVLDGVAVGLGFAASLEIGLVVAAAVLAHGFADGLNVVTLALANGRGQRTAAALLSLVALAPPVGVAIGSLIPVSEQVLGVLLAAFAGVFVAIGAGHLLPEARHGRAGAGPPLILLAAAGVAVVLLVRSLVPDAH
jgi:zinc transporter ZupT